MTQGLPQLGAPGIYQLAPSITPTLGGVRLDVCAFVGVAPRGPAWVPVRDEQWRDDRPTVGAGRQRRRSVAVPVGSFEEYRQIFGGFEGPGRLPYAVRAYFENGGRIAWVVRVTPPVGGDATLGVGRVALPGLTNSDGVEALVFARSEGRWSQSLRLALGFDRTPLGSRTLDPAGTGDPVTALRFRFGEAPPVGSLLAVHVVGQQSLRRFVVALLVEGGEVQAVLDAPVRADEVTLEVIHAELWLDDGDGRSELHRGLGLSPDHPRWLATVLCHESALAWPDEAWTHIELEPTATVLPPLDFSRPVVFGGGADRHHALTVEHFFDEAWNPYGERPGDGIAAVADAPEVATVVVPDLYHPAALLVHQDIRDRRPSRADHDWHSCLQADADDLVTDQECVPPRLPGLVCDPRDPTQLAQIIAAQRRLVAHAEALEIVALLDAPPGLEQRQLLAWRQEFASSWAVAYHPWLRLSADSDAPSDAGPARLGPAAVAAGIIARRERVHGVPHGPANELAASVVDVEERLSPARHDLLHAAALNVFLRERDGVRLTAARTLSADPRLRQLSVRRLMQLLHRTVRRELQWAVFEPNDARLQKRLRDALRTFLRGLYLQGAFRGERESEAFFVRCDETNNPRLLAERGEFLVEIGVAPAEPLEFIVLAIKRDPDGQLEVTPR